jgi:hypothetical protein
MSYSKTAIKNCMMCESQLGWLKRVLHRRFCGGTCKAEYYKLMTNLALARLDAGPVQEAPEIADRKREMSALARMMQVDVEERSRMERARFSEG